MPHQGEGGGDPLLLQSVHDRVDVFVDCEESVGGRNGSAKPQKIQGDHATAIGQLWNHIFEGDGGGGDSV